jgi:carbon starvation protein
LGRYILQELFHLQWKVGAILATGATLAIPTLFLVTANPQEQAWKKYWTLFGTSNQLLAALTLLGITVWLKRSGRRLWFTVLPMLFVMTITIWSLVLQIVQAFRVPISLHPTSMNGIVAVLLCGLALHLIVESGWILIRRDKRLESSRS